MKGSIENRKIQEGKSISRQEGMVIFSRIGKLGR